MLGNFRGYRDQEGVVIGDLAIFHVQVEETQIVGVFMRLNDDHAIDLRGLLQLGMAVAAHDDIQFRHGLGQFNVLAVAKVAQGDQNIHLRANPLGHHLGNGDGLMEN